jgi:hypothetical protein
MTTNYSNNETIKHELSNSYYFNVNKEKVIVNGGKYYIDGITDALPDGVSYSFLTDYGYHTLNSDYSSPLSSRIYKKDVIIGFYCYDGSFPKVQLKKYILPIPAVGSKSIDKNFELIFIVDDFERYNNMCKFYNEIPWECYKI